MIQQIIGKKIEELDSISTRAYDKVIIDLGCGDGKQMYRLASKDLTNMYIGIDANASELEEISQKITKKPEKGGLLNVIYVQSRVEELPDELRDIADEVHINFPWGTLLEGIVQADGAILENIKKIMKDGAELHIWLTYDDKYEEAYRQERNLPDLSLEYFQEILGKKYQEYGLYLLYPYTLLPEEKAHIDSPWGKKILSKRDREVYKLQFKVKK